MPAFLNSNSNKCEPPRQRNHHQYSSNINIRSFTLVGTAGEISDQTSVVRPTSTHVRQEVPAYTSMHLTLATSSPRCCSMRAISCLSW